MTEIDVAAAISGASGVEPPVVKPPSVVPSPSAALSAGFASFFVSTGSVSVPSFGSETRGGAVATGSACCANGSLLAKRSKVASWPWTASGERSESATAESSGAGAAGTSPVVAPGVGVTPGVVAGAAEVVVGVVTGGGPDSIFSVFGPWNPSSASRRTAPPIAIFFCLASFAFSGSMRFAITQLPRFLLPRCLRAAEPPRPPSSSPAASPPEAEPRSLPC